MKTSYMVNPPKVYVSNKFIKPQEVTSVLDSALVEVHFTVKQYWINSRTPVINSFSALVQQVIVLKHAKCKSSPYKKKDYRKGPIIMPVSPIKIGKEMISAGIFSHLY